MKKAVVCLLLALTLSVLCQRQVIDALMTDPAYGELKAALGLGADSRVLLFSTEGDTDPENYRNIVWGGAYPTPEG